MTYITLQDLRGGKGHGGGRGGKGGRGGRGGGAYPYPVDQSVEPLYVIDEDPDVDGEDPDDDGDDTPAPQKRLGMSSDLSDDPTAATDPTAAAAPADPTTAAVAPATTPVVPTKKHFRIGIPGVLTILAGAAVGYLVGRSLASS